MRTESTAEGRKDSRDMVASPDDPELTRVAGRLLLRLLHAGSPGQPDALEELPPGLWEELGELAGRHRVAALLSWRLEERGWDRRVPAAVMERLRSAYRESAERSARLRSELGAVLTAFRAKGLQVIVLKGAHLAEHAYEDPALRPMRDLDLLVREEDLTRAEQELSGLGYRRSEASRDEPDYSTHRHLRPFVRPGAFPIEIHRTIESSCRETDIPEIWKRARTTRIAGSETLVLGWEDLLVHLGLHLAGQHGFQVPLNQMVDIPQVLARCAAELDWQKFLAIAEQSGASRLCFYLLAVAEEMLGAEIPDGILTALNKASSDLALVTVIAEYVLLRPMYRVPHGLGDALQATGAGARWRAACRNLFPAPERLREIYSLRPGSPAVYWYYAVRPWDLLVRRGSFLLRLASPGSSARCALDLEAKRLLIESRLRQ